MAVIIKKSAALAAIALALNGSSMLTTAALARPPATAARSCAGDEALREDIARFMTELYRTAYPEAVAPGFAVAVIRRDCDIFARGFGYADLAGRRPVDEHSAFYIASATKAFVGLTAELLHRQGRIDLDSPMTRYVSGLQLTSPLDARRITLRQLLTHTHGIQNWGPVVFRSAITGQGDSRRLLALLSSHEAAPNGNAFAYGNIGYNAAGLIIHSATGRQWQDSLQQLVLRPLGLNATTPYISRVPRARMALPYMFDGAGYAALPQAKANSNMHAAGGMFSSLADMTQWLRVNMAGGRIGGRTVVPGAAIEAAQFARATRSEPMPGPFPMTAYGLGWDEGSYRGERLLMSQGGFSAYQSLVTYMPDQDLGIVILTNEAGSGEDILRTVSQYVYDVALGGAEAREQWARRMQQLPRMVRHSRERIAADHARRRARPQASVAELAASVGTYRNPDWGTFEVTLHDGRLQVRAGAARSIAEPYNLDRHEWRIELQPARGETIQFALSGASAQTLNYGGVTFTRVR